MKSIKLKLVDFWGGIGKDEQSFYNFPLIKTLQKRYNVIYSDEPDFIIYSVFGYEHLKYNCVRIFYTFENQRADWNIADYGLTMDYDCFEDRHCHIDQQYLLHTSFEHNVFNNRDMHKIRNKFCSIMVTNPALSYSPRKIFFDKLSVYKRVDSGGKWNNNIGGGINNNWSYIKGPKIEWLKQYKFNICFENSSYPGYLTEKIFDAFEAGCIPIYWGDTSLRCGLNLKSGKFGEIDNRIPKIDPSLLVVRINPKSFINAHNYSSWDELVEEIKRIDNDEKAYLEMLSQPIFLENFNFLDFNNKVDDFLYSIFDQDPKDAFRRGIAQRIEGALILKKEGIASKNKDIIIESKNSEIERLSDIISSQSFKKDKLKVEYLELKNKNIALKNQKLRIELCIPDQLDSLSHTHNTATNRIKNQLSYKLGRAMIDNSKSLWGYIRMPYVLSYIRDIHNKEQMAYNERIKKNPSLKLPPLESYPDYKEALKYKEHLSYKLGQAMIEADKSLLKLGYLTLWFKCKKI